MNKSINQTFICSQEFSNTVMEATIVDFTQPLKPTSLAWENPLISVKLATMCLFSSMIFTRIISRTNHTTSRTIYNNWAQQHYQGYPPSAVNIWMFIHSIALQWQAINHFTGPRPPFGRKTHLRRCPPRSHTRARTPRSCTRVRPSRSRPPWPAAGWRWRRNEDCFTCRKESHWEWTRFDYHFDK